LLRKSFTYFLAKNLPVQGPKRRCSNLFDLLKGD